MALDYKDKITMKFNVYQLNRIILALINNGYNRKFASNVKRLFAIFNPAFYKTEYDKDVRVYLINELVEIILNKNIESKEAILSFLDTDGRYYNDTVTILNELYEEELLDSELAYLDKVISEQLKYSTVMNSADDLSDMLMNLKAENYDDLGQYMANLETTIETMNRDIKASRESIEDSKKDLNLSSNSFIDVLGEIIDEERNPASKIKTGIQYINQVFDGGFEKGRLYIACRSCKRLEVADFY